MALATAAQRIDLTFPLVEKYRGFHSLLARVDPRPPLPPPNRFFDFPAFPLPSPHWFPAAAEAEATTAAVFANLILQPVRLDICGILETSGDRSRETSRFRLNYELSVVGSENRGDRSNILRELKESTKAGRSGTGRPERKSASGQPEIWTALERGTEPALTETPSVDE